MQEKHKRTEGYKQKNKNVAEHCVLHKKTQAYAQAGITLIALVVTIIVLLILAGVTIRLALDNSGIIGRAKMSSNTMVEATANELTQLRQYERDIDTLTGNQEGAPTSSLPATAVGQAAGTPIQNPESYGSNPKAQATADGDDNFFALPTGFEYVEGNVRNGVVITDEKNASGTSIGNEFVWIPIDYDADSDAIMVAGTNKYMAKPTTAGGSNYRGVLYNWNESGYPEYDWFAEYNNDDYGEKWGNSNNGSGYREPAYLTSSSSGDASSYNKNNGVEIVTQSGLEYEYNSMIESVKKYGGFYVGRYELGQTAFSKAGTVPANASEESTKMWYGLYNKAKTYSNASVTSQMIWGSQYDAMLQWMILNGVNVTSEIPITGARYNSTRIAGATYDEDNEEIINDEINHIYDLLGNSSEATQEAHNDDCRTWRGDSYYMGASLRSDYDNSRCTEQADWLGTRISIYVKI